MFYWITLSFAIFCEISGTLCLKWAVNNNTVPGFVLAILMIAISYIFLSISVKKIALGVAYAMWEGVGILLITLFSLFLFQETCSFLKIVSMVLLIAGIILIKAGTTKRAGEIGHGAI